MKFKSHICKSECNCEVCREYVNKFDEKRNHSNGGEQKSKKLLALSRTSGSKVVRRGKRKFDLPKPVLTRPFSKENKK